MSENNENQKKDLIEEESLSEENSKLIDQQEEISEADEKEDTKKSENEIKKSDSEKTKKKLSRRAKRRAVSWATICLVVVCVIIVNVIAMTLTDKFSSLTADITEKSSFALTEQSVKIAEELKKDVTITFLMTKADYESHDTYCRQTSELTRQLAQNSDGMISVEYIDLIKNPTYESKFPNETLSTTSLIVQCGEKYDVLDKYDLFNFQIYSTDYEYVVSSKAEEAIDSAILTVTRDSVTNVAIIKDNSKGDYSYLTNVLLNNSYNVTEISLLTEDIPKDTDFLISYTPSKDYTEDSVKKIEEYLNNNSKYGKSMLYVPYGDVTVTPNIDSLLEKWGIKVHDGLAFDMDTGRITGTNYYDGIVTYFDSDKYTENISTSDYPVLISRARPITLLDDENTEVLLKLSSQSGYCPFDATEENWNMYDAVVGDMPVMVQSVQGKDNENSTLIAAGSSYMFEKTHMNSLFSNEEYFLNMVADLTGREPDDLQIKNRVINDFDLTISNQTALIVGVAIFAVLPLIILGAGFCVYLVRKGK